MRSLNRWIGAALPGQPFYAEDIRLIGLMAQVWRPSLPHRLRAGR